MENLAVILPIYNEEEGIKAVLEKWCLELDHLDIDYKIFAYNDGSKDNTANILEETAKNNEKIIIINKENSGHGPTILNGYREVSPNFTWIFQTDSDDEMEPDYLKVLWRKREGYDFLIGIRDNRRQPFSRKIISFVSRLCIRVFYGWGPKDVNCPYRLIRSEKFIDLFNKIPSSVFSPNVILSGIVSKKKIKFYEVLIPCQGRQTGEVSIQKIKLLKAAINSFWQTVLFSFTRF